MSLGVAEMTLSGVFRNALFEFDVSFAEFSGSHFANENFAYLLEENNVEKANFYAMRGEIFVCAV